MSQQRVAPALLESPSGFRQRLRGLPVRSFLFRPGSDQITIAEATADPTSFGADAVIFDLEEPPRPSPLLESARVEARECLREFFDRPSRAEREPQWWVRVQSVDTHQTLKDLEAVMGPNLSGIMLPKSLSRDDIVRADALVGNVEAKLGLEVGSTLFFPLLETPSAIRSAYEIADASERVTYMGGHTGISGDNARTVGYSWTQEGLESLFIRSKVIVDARSAGVRFPIGGMWCGDKDDLDGLREFSLETKRLGYYGMLLAWPQHVAVVNEVFTPDPDDVARWKLVRDVADAADPEQVPLTYQDASGQTRLLTEKEISMARAQLEWAEGVERVRFDRG